jgi:hypothetical protein
MVVSVVELGLAMALQAIHQAPFFAPFVVARSMWYSSVATLVLKAIKTKEIVSKKEKDKLERVS